MHGARGDPQPSYHLLVYTTTEWRVKSCSSSCLHSGMSNVLKLPSQKRTCHPWPFSRPQGPRSRAGERVGVLGGESGKGDVLLEERVAMGGEWEGEGLPSPVGLRLTASRNACESAVVGRVPAGACSRGATGVARCPERCLGSGGGWVGCGSKTKPGRAVQSPSAPIWPWVASSVTGSARRRTSGVIASGVLRADA